MDARVPRLALAWMGALAAGAAACDGLLGDVQIETARLSTPGADPAASDGSDGGPAGGPAPPVVCERATQRCVDGRLERCDAEGAGWELLDRCATDVLCALALQAEGVACEAPRCAPGEFRCDGAALERCDDGRTGFERETLCGAAVFCDPEAGRCRERACAPGERRCNGAQIEACTAEGDAFTPIDTPPCATSTLCARTGDGEVSCRVPVCGAGEFRCVGDGLLQRCSAGRDGWEDVRACEALEVCDAALGPLGCRAADCQAGERRCADDALLECNASRDGFDVVARCGAAGCDAEALACSDPCVVGVLRCSGADVEACSDPLTGWQVVATCPASAVCDAAAPSGCRAAACAAGERRCDGARVERCDAARAGFELEVVCATAALCEQNGDDAACAAPACASGERECRGRDLFICNADQTGFDQINCGILGCDPNADPPDCRSLF